MYNMCIHIYIYIERERETYNTICVYIHIISLSLSLSTYIYIYIYIYIPGPRPNFEDTFVCCSCLFQRACLPFASQLSRVSERRAHGQSVRESK